MFLLFLFIFSACSYFSKDVPEEIIALDVPTSVDFSEDVDHMIHSVRVLWENKTTKDKREAQKILLRFYEEKAQHVFAFLHTEHGNDILAAEHQLGWVIHRLERHTSRSFRREAGYLEKLSRHLKTCSSLLPVEVASEETLEIPASDGEEISKSPVQQSF